MVPSVPRGHPLLAREPDSGELSLFTAAMGAGWTRRQVAQAVVALPEFHEVFTWAEHIYYLGRIPTGPEVAAEAAQLASSGGVAFWVGRLDQGTWTRSAVATNFLRTTEAARRRVEGGPGEICDLDDLGTGLDGLQGGTYCMLLGRDSDPAGADHWTAYLSGSGQLPALWTSVMASAEYFAGAQALGPPGSESRPRLRCGRHP